MRDDLPQRPSPGFSAREKLCPQCAGLSRRIEPLGNRLPDIPRTQRKASGNSPEAFLVFKRGKAF